MLIFAITLLFCTSSVYAEEKEHTIDPGSAEFWGEIVAILFLVLLSGIVAGNFKTEESVHVY